MLQITKYTGRGYSNSITHQTVIVFLIGGDCIKYPFASVDDRERAEWLAGVSAPERGSRLHSVSDHSLSCWFASISGCGLNRNLDTGGEGPWRKSTSRN